MASSCLYTSRVGIVVRSRYKVNVANSLVYAETPFESGCFISIILCWCNNLLKTIFWTDTINNVNRHLIVALFRKGQFGIDQIGFEFHSRLVGRSIQTTRRHCNSLIIHVWAF